MFSETKQKPNIKTIAMVENVVNSARDNMKNCGDLMPVAFISNGEEATVVGMAFSNQQEKVAVAGAIKNIVDKFKATSVLFVMEAYMLNIEKDELEEFKESGLRVSQHPKSQECVMISLETRTGSWMAQAEIINENGVKTFLMPSFKEAESEGIFSNLINLKLLLN